MALPAPSLLLPRFVQFARAETLDLPLKYPDDTAATVTAGTYTLLDSAGVEVVTGAVVVVSGVATFALPSTFTDEYGLPQNFAWRERWELTGISGTALAMTFEQQVHVERVAPAMLIGVGNLYELHSEWRRQIPKSTTTPAEKVIVAWQELLGRLLGDGHLPHKVLNWWALSVVHKYWAASLVCRGWQTDNPGDSRWAKLADEYWKRSQTDYEQHFSLQADTNDDGVADTPGKLDAGQPQTFLTNMPYSDPFGGGRW